MSQITLVTHSANKGPGYVGRDRGNSAVTIRHRISKYSHLLQIYRRQEGLTTLSVSLFLGFLAFRLPFSFLVLVALYLQLRCTKKFEIWRDKQLLASQLGLIISLSSRSNKLFTSRFSFNFL